MPTSSTIEEQPERNDNDREDSNFWGRFRSGSKTGVFGDRMSLTDDDVEEEDDEESDDDDDEAADYTLDDDDDDDEGDSIEIFGHR